MRVGLIDRRRMMTALATTSTVALAVAGVTVAADSSPDSSGARPSAVVARRASPAGLGAALQAAPTTSVVLPPLPRNTGPDATFAGPIVGPDETVGTAGPDPTPFPVETVAPAESTPIETAESTPADPSTPQPGGGLLLQLVDDLGMLEVSVPGSWTDVLTEPLGENPAISASPDWTQWEEFADPGLIFVAYPFVADVDAVLAADELSELCTARDRSEFAQRQFTGVQQIFDDCGPSQATNYVWLVSPPDQSYTLYVNVQLVEPTDDGGLNLVRASFDTDPAVPLPDDAGDAPTVTSPTESSVPIPSSDVVTPSTDAPVTTAGPVITAGPVTTEVPPVLTTMAPTVPPPTVPTGYQVLTDNTGIVELVVPIAWSDVDLQSVTLENGERSFAVSASPDLDGFRQTFTTPGVYVQGAEAVTDPARLLARYAPALDDDCAAGAIQALDHPQLIGVQQQWTDCEGAGFDFTVVVANPIDPTLAGGRTVVMFVQLPSGEEFTLGVLISSLLLTGKA